MDANFESHRPSNQTALKGASAVSLSYTLEVNTSAYAEQLVNNQLPSSLPLMIEDAIHVARSLDIPYLWVDKYRIAQQDTHEKMHLIKVRLGEC
jgi:hypothetical protein